MELTAIETESVHEWMTRMKNKEPGFFKRELDGKVVLVSKAAIPSICRERLNARIQRGEIKLALDHEGIEIYEFVEKD